MLLSLWLGFLPANPLQAQPRVVIISPHNEAIREEFGQAFVRWHREQFREEAVVEWRDVGGTSDILRFVLSEFANKPGGIGIDCFFGGGPEPLLVLADKKLTKPYTPPAEIMAAVPPTCNGVEIYDANHHWHGAAISSFGIVQNTRVQTILGLPLATRWADLADPGLFGWVEAGDPRNSGTMTVMFESFLQAFGWERGWQLLTRLGANVRKFDRVSSSTAKEVTLGEAAYGLAIDFYGFTQVAAAGRTNMTFVLPQDFAAVIPDGIALLKGTPNLPTAQRFVDFVLGEPGQKLWFLPRGHAEGPQRHSIERMSIRPDFYARYRDVSNIAFSPFELSQSFRYNAALARERRDVIAALVGALLVDTHTELKAAWQAVVQKDLQPAAVGELGRMPLTEVEATQLARGKWKDAAARNQLKIDWQIWAQDKYRRIAGARASAARTSAISQGALQFREPLP
ncbi:MAG: ABC transporter substrate-binding protein [Verrucomicrobia bacterium]|nr:ABC transporter substrate-binding protein [Verrucomicrobiota bacterium]